MIYYLVTQLYTVGSMVNIYHSRIKLMLCFVNKKANQRIIN